MKLVCIESPFAGNTEKNLRYARACMRDCILRGESPYASHALYTQDGVLDDSIPEERDLGMQCGFDWGAKADCRCVYTDLGVSWGMIRGIEEAMKRGQKVEFRTLGGEWSKK